MERLARFIGVSLAMMLSPGAVAVFVLLVGVALAVSGVYLVFGLGWALIACASPFLALAAVLIRGVLRVR